MRDGRILSSLARRAYRGPVSDADMTRLLVLLRRRSAQNGGDFDAGIESALRSCSSTRGSSSASSRTRTRSRPARSIAISDLELASRLSFFLWSSIPDEELLTARRPQGRLRNPAVLEQQVRRMLKDERARALGSNFAGQWLYLRNLAGLQPDADVFPDFDHNLREALQRETEMLFESIVLEDKSVPRRCSNADYTFVNERLARHYGIPNVYGTQFRRVAVTDDARTGPARPRQHPGAHLAEQPHVAGDARQVRADQHPGHAAAGAAGQRAAARRERREKRKSMRERMEEHRSNPACAGCHKLMDPDRAGARELRWHRRAGGRSTTARPSIRPHSCPTARRSTARPRCARPCCGDPEMFARNMTEMLLTYAPRATASSTTTCRSCAPILKRRGSAPTTVLVARPRHRQERAVPEEESRVMIDHEEGHPPPHRAARPRRHGGAAAARQHGAGRDGAGPDAGRADAAVRLRLRAARLDHARVDAGAGGRQLRVLADPQAARIVPQARHRAQQPLQLR